jgi:hypothetical protein
LLKHLRLGDKNEALLGDLYEEFKRRHSAAWYWRQVLAAILVGFIREVRCRWMAIAFAIVWTYAVALWFLRQIWLLPQIHSLSEPLFRWSLKFDFPVSQIWYLTIYLSIDLAIGALIVMVGLVLYLAIMKSFTLRSFLRGSAVAIFVIALGNVCLTFSEYLVDLRSPRLVGFAVASIPMFLGLLFSMLAALRTVERGRARSIQSMPEDLCS